jgi:hypothetical protein
LRPAQAKFMRHHLNKWLGMIVHTPVIPVVQGRTKKRIMVQTDPGINISR